MSPRLVLALPLAFVLGCGAAPPPAAATAPPAEAATGSPAATPAASAAAATTPPPPPAAAGEARKAEAPAPGKAGADAAIMTKITQEDILQSVNKNAETFDRCYKLGAGASKSYRAKVTVKATVSPTGSVNAVEIVASTSKNPKVDACVVEGFKKLTFNRPAGSGATVFTFPLSFDGVEQVQ